MTPVIRLLASVPSVVYGLIGVLVLVPFVGNHLISSAQKQSVVNVIQLTGAGLLVSVVILTVMITPIMTALITDALGSVPRSWHEGAIALGLNPLRATLRRLASRDPPGDHRRRRARHRARDRRGDHDLDGLRRQRIRAQLRRRADLPVRAAAHRRGRDRRAGRRASALRRCARRIYAFALLLLFSGFMLSLASHLARLPLRKYELSS